MADSSTPDRVLPEKEEGFVDEAIKGTESAASHDEDGPSEEDARKIALRAKYVPLRKSGVVGSPS